MLGVYWKVWGFFLKSFETELKGSNQERIFESHLKVEDYIKSLQQLNERFKTGFFLESFWKVAHFIIILRNSNKRFKTLQNIGN